MSAALDLISIVEQAGGRFLLDGDRLGIAPKEAAMPVLDQLRQHKAELIAEISRRPAMPPGVKLTRWQPATGPVQLSSCSVVTAPEKFIRMTLVQLDARLHGKAWHAGNWSLCTLLERLAAVGCHVALDNPSRMLQ